jgi:hypothetical protein
MSSSGNLVPPPQKRRLAFPVLLLLVSLVFLRPGVLGGTFSAVGIALAALAALVSFATDRGKITSSRATKTVVLLVAASYLWALIAATWNGTNSRLIGQGAIVTLVVLVSASIVLSSHRRVVQFVRGFVALIIVIGIFYVITFIAWQIAGIGSFRLGGAFLGTWQYEAYFPFTVTVGNQTALGIAFPRLTGIGREPGWMAMYAGLAWFLWPLVGRPRWWGRLALLVAMLAPFSTAGFGIFVVVLAYDLLLKPRPYKDIFLAFLRQAFGLALMGFAIWLAVFAPVFGLAAKSTQNVLSLNERNAVTAAGWEALTHLSLGSPVGYANSSLNLIASVAQNGWPYSLLIAGAILLPRIGHRAVSKTTAPIAVIFLTLLLAQPPGDSILVFLLAMAVYEITSELQISELNQNSDFVQVRSSPVRTGKPAPTIRR